MAVRVPASPVAPVADGSGGRRLRAAMRSEGVTVARLSKLTGLSQRTITKLRSGASEGNAATWRAISRALGKPIDELVEG